MSDLLAIPLAVLMMGILDYVVGVVLFAVLGPIAILYVALMVVLEVYALARSVASNSESL